MNEVKIKMDLIGLRYFCLAAEYESFSRVAKENRIPVSSVSQVIKRIEGELGAPLFDRSGNKVRLNPAGKRYYDRISSALSEIDTAMAEISNARECAGEIKLLVLANRQRVAMGIKNFIKKYQGVSFSISHRANEALSEYDIIISDSIPDLLGYRRELFIREKMLLAANSTSDLLNSLPLNEKILAKQKYITMLEDSRLYKKTAEIFSELGISPEISVKCDDPGIIREYVEMGLGVCIFPAISWGNVFSNDISFIDIGEFYRSTYIFAKESSLSESRIKLFINELKAPVL